MEQGPLAGPSTWALPHYPLGTISGQSVMMNLEPNNSSLDEKPALTESKKRAKTGCITCRLRKKVGIQ